jgi:hypothetical protein
MTVRTRWTTSFPFYLRTVRSTMFSVATGRRTARRSNGHRQDLSNPIREWAEHGAAHKMVPYTVTEDTDAPSPDSGEEGARQEPRATLPSPANGSVNGEVLAKCVKSVSAAP